MPAIWNINNSYNTNNNQKVASKLAFNVGEKFSGKIIKKGDGNEVSIKLTDGWEFSAEVDGDLEALDKGFARFEVEGFKDGKLKLKLINKEASSTDVGKGELKDIITKEGLSKKDIPLLEAMLKFDIPLSRENIKMVKGLVEFNDKIQGNPKEIENFIAKYLESKGIDPNSNKGKDVTLKLQEFFDAFKNLSKDDVLLFLENNIEFTKENIESYNKLFKEQGKTSDVVSAIKNELGKVLQEGEVELLKLAKSIEGSVDVKQNSVNKDNNISNRVNSKSNNNGVGKFVNGNSIINEKSIMGNYNSNDFIQNKGEVIAILKNIIGEGENLLNTQSKDIINNKAEFSTKEIEKAYVAINKIAGEKLSLGAGAFNKSELENLLSKAVGKNITVTDDQYNKIKDNINFKFTEGENLVSNTEGLKDNNSYNKLGNEKDIINEKGIVLNSDNNDEKFGVKELSFNKLELESALSKLVGKNVTVTNEQHNKIKDNINLKLNNGETLGNTSILEVTNNKEIEKNLNLRISGERVDSLKDILGSLDNEVIKNIINSKVESQSSKLATDTYEKNEFSQNKVSVLAVLKSLMGEGENKLNVELKNLLNSKRAELTTKEFDKAYNAINKMDDASFISMIEGAIDEYNNSPEKQQNSFSDYINKKNDDAKYGAGDLSFNKRELESALSKVVGKNITVTDEQYKKIKDIINLNIVEGENKVNANGLNKINGQPIVKEAALVDTPENISNENGADSDKVVVNPKSDNAESLKALIKEKLTSQELVKSIINSKGEEGKELIKEIISSIKTESAVSEKIIDVIKNNISDVKLFNKISQEYYYLNVPVKIKEQEYPCKLILKDNRKDGKKIDSKNVKMVVTVKTANLGVVDGYMKVFENKIDIDLKCEKSFMKIFDLGKEKLISNIKNLGFNISVKVSKKEDEVSLTSCRKFFNENNRVNLDIKV